MRKFLAAIMTTATLATTAHAGERLSFQLHGLVTPCRTSYTDFTDVRWTNDSGAVLYLREARVWAGHDQGRIADVTVSLIRERDGNLIVWAPRDHYADNAQPIITIHTYTPDYVVILPGDVLLLRVSCVWWKGTEAPMTAATAWISVLTERPKE